MSSTPSKRYFEDLAIGQKFASGSIEVTREAIMRFAAAFDPQPFHLSEDGGRESLFGGLAASGWHTAAMTMRLLVDSDLRPAGGIIGGGMDELRWPRPVRPDDTLTLDIEVIGLRPSASKPRQGLAKIRVTTLNQRGEPVQILMPNLIVPRRIAPA